MGKFRIKDQITSDEYNALVTAVNESACSSVYRGFIKDGEVSELGWVFIAGRRSVTDTVPYPPAVQAVLDAAVVWELIRTDGKPHSAAWDDAIMALSGSVRAYHESLKPSPSIKELEIALNKACDELKRQALSSYPVDQYVVDDYNTKSREYHAALCHAQDRMEQAAQSKADRIAEATECLIAAIGVFFSDGQKDAHDLYLCWCKLQEAEGKES